MTAKATYVYCAVQARRKPALPQSPSGPPGLGRQRVLDAGRGLWLIVADAPLSRFGEEPIRRGLQNLKWLSRCAIGHEAVVEHCLRARAVVPMKLFTLFENDFRAVTEIDRRRGEIDQSMKRVAGRREWGVRVRALAAEEPAMRAGKRRVRSGTSYLTAKREARDAVRESLRKAETRATTTFAALAALSVDARRNPSAGADVNRLLLDAAFLVSTGSAARFRTAARRLARTLGKEGYGVEITGPWPPYNFIAP
jgi:hypothetical protein